MFYDTIERKDFPMSQKKAILLVSFGTSYLESKAKTIDRIFTDVTEHFPDYAIYEAWTSKMILNILRKRDNLSIQIGRAHV